MYHVIRVPFISPEAPKRLKGPQKTKTKKEKKDAIRVMKISPEVPKARNGPENLKMSRQKNS